MRIFIVFGLLLFIVALALYTHMNSSSKIETQQSNMVRFVSLGDSYTSGEGVLVGERWPNVLVDKLNESGVAIELVANPAVSGFTTRNVIENELSVLESVDPTFVSLLIGANDLALGVDQNTFRGNLQTILDRIQLSLPQKNNIVLITIPDFSKTPRGQQFGDEKFLNDKIQEFNTIIKEEGEKRDLTVIDIFPVSQNVEDDPSLIVADGLHPSATQYRQWVEVLLPEVKKMITTNE